MAYDSGTRIARCLECGDRIEYGRQDKKFCCDTCKNRWNNRKARRSRTARMKVLSALDRNYRILDRLLKTDCTSISVAELRQMGFNFDYVTSYHKVRRHDEFACFDILFVVMSVNVISISRIGQASGKGKLQDISLNLQNVPHREK